MLLLMLLLLLLMLLLLLYVRLLVSGNGGGGKFWHKGGDICGHDRQLQNVNKAGQFVALLGRSDHVT